MLNNKLIKKVLEYKSILIPLIYFILYFNWWFWLQNMEYESIYVLHSRVDDMISFNEFFVVPYIIWFAYIFLVFLILLLKDKKSYYKMCLYAFIGMTICLIIYTLFPVTHNLRPERFPRQNIFVDMVAFIYKNDRPLNLFPSIHCYNSIVAFIMIIKSEKLNKNKILVYSSFILSTLICISTLAIKQHSFYDFVSAVVLSIIVYIFVFKEIYRLKFLKFKK